MVYLKDGYCANGFPIISYNNKDYSFIEVGPVQYHDTKPNIETKIFLEFEQDEKTKSKMIDDLWKELGLELNGGTIPQWKECVKKANEWFDSKWEHGYVENAIGSPMTYMCLKDTNIYWGHSNVVLSQFRSGYFREILYTLW